MKPVSDGRDAISDPAIQRALADLAESRQRLAGWTAQMAARMGSQRSEGFGFGSFQPRSKTLQMLMSLGLSRMPWMRWGIAVLPLLLRFWRQR
jgi:CRP-like cAMP-binding protein